MKSTYEVHVGYVQDLFDSIKEDVFFGTTLRFRMITEVLAPAVSDLVRCADEVVVKDEKVEKRVHLWEDRKFDKPVSIEAIKKMYDQHRASLNYDDKVKVELEEMNGLDFTDELYPINPKSRASVSCWVGLIGKFVEVYEDWAEDLTANPRWIPEASRSTMENFGGFIDAALDEFDKMLADAEKSGTRAMTAGFVKRMKDGSADFRTRNEEAAKKLARK